MHAPLVVATALWWKRGSRDRFGRCTPSSSGAPKARPRVCRPQGIPRHGFQPRQPDVGPCMWTHAAHGDMAGRNGLKTHFVRSQVDIKGTWQFLGAFWTPFRVPRTHQKYWGQTRTFPENRIFSLAGPSNSGKCVFQEMFGFDPNTSGAFWGP